MIILASASPRRSELLSRITDNFKVVIPYSKEISAGDSLEFVAEQNAILKARAVAEKGDFSEDIVLGADTVVFFKGKMFGKPTDADHAMRMLTDLSGGTHKVVTGVCVIGKQGCFSGTEISLVTFNHLSSKVKDAYIQSGNYAGKAGAYGLQDGMGLVKSVEGSRENVIGLPLELCAKLITHAGGGSLLKP